MRKPRVGIIGFSDGDPEVHEQLKDVVQTQLDAITNALLEDGRVEVVAARGLVNSSATAKQYAEEGFDGIIHLKSSGCTPEIDCMPVLQRLSSDYRIPILYLSYDSQTSDTGLDTRLEAFYDMIAMRKAR